MESYGQEEVISGKKNANTYRKTDWLAYSIYCERQHFL
jgi:hypothetical protein